MRLLLSVIRFFDGLLRRLLLFLIALYQKIIPFFIPHSPCRFNPSCSVYAQQAFRKYPFFKAFGMSLWRILRCNPWSPGGDDPLL